MSAAATRHPLDSLFNPLSVAMVGASASPEKMGGRRWKTLVEGGFTGPLYPINPKANEVRGHRAYKTIRDVPGPVDLAVVVVAPEQVPAVVGDCASLGARNVVIITAGFGEVTAEGKQIEAQLVRTMRGTGGRLVGPNCSGLFSASGKMHVGGWETPPGFIGLISQSGNMALDFCQMARERQIGFSRYITIGNAADIRTEDVIDYLLWDDETKVILAYVEGFAPGEGRRIYELVRSHPHRKPIVILKPGRSEMGRNAALSHTGSLAGEDRIVGAAFQQCGVIRAHEVEEAWELALALGGLPKPSNSGIGVLTDGGGHATLFCDAAGMRDLITPRPSPPVMQALRELLPSRCPIDNPIDFAGVAEGDPEVVPRALELCLSDPQIGSAVMVGHFGGYHKIGGASLMPLEEKAAQKIVEIAHRAGKPVMVHSVHGHADLPALKILRTGGVPVFRAIEMPSKVLSGLRHSTKSAFPAKLPRRSREAASRDAQPWFAKAADSSHGRWLQEPEARKVLEAFGIDLTPTWTVTSAEECEKVASGLQEPMALKLISPEALHKTEVGGVLLNVQPRQAADAFRQLIEKQSPRSAVSSRVLMAKMVKAGTEFACGALRDPQFGPVVMVGLGGIHLELHKDVAFRLAPLSEEDAEELLSHLRIAPLFDGYRGAPPLARAALVDLLIRLSELMVDRDDIEEIDLNPVFLDATRATIADARIILTKDVP